MARATPSYKIIRDTPVEAPPPKPRKRPGSVGASSIAKHDVGLIHGTEGKILTPAEIRSRIINMMAARNYDPVKELIDMALSKDAEGNYIYDAEFRKNIHTELIPYVAPKLKATEITGSVDMSIKISVVKFNGNEPKTVSADGPPIDV